MGLALRASAARGAAPQDRGERQAGRGYARCRWAGGDDAGGADGGCGEAGASGGAGTRGGDGRGEDGEGGDVSLELLGATLLKVLACPQCGAPIERTEEYRARWINIPTIRGPLRELVAEDVTLICLKCEWRERTNNWRQYLQGTIAE